LNLLDEEEQSIRRMDYPVTSLTEMTVPTSKSKSPPPTQAQDTPGRPKASSSRQQTHPDQGEQTGSPAIDANSKNTAKPKRSR
jgi:hypothetical protein